MRYFHSSDKLTYEYFKWLSTKIAFDSRINDDIYYSINPFDEWIYDKDENKFKNVIKNIITKYNIKNKSLNYDFERFKNIKFAIYGRNIAYIANSTISLNNINLKTSYAVSNSNNSINELFEYMTFCISIGNVSLIKNIVRDILLKIEINKCIEECKTNKKCLLSARKINSPNIF